MKLKYKITKEGCWKCTSHCTNNQGYVKITIKGKQDYGHRYMYKLKNGDINNEVVRHICDNRWCINPDHLIQGSHQDNVNDRVLRERSATGESNGRSKLSEEDVLNIFYDYKTPKMELARQHNVDPKVIRNIKNKVTWKYLTKDF